MYVTLQSSTFDVFPTVHHSIGYAVKTNIDINSCKFTLILIYLINFITSVNSH